MKLFDWLFKPRAVQVEDDTFFPGVIDDPRPKQQREFEDIPIKELVGALDTVEWREKSASELRRFPDQDQAGQSSCVANSGRKALRVMHIVNNRLDLDHSSAHIYRRRANYPLPGMWRGDLYNIMAQGTTLNALLPSDGLTEEQVNATKLQPYQEEVGKLFKIGGGIVLPAGDIDAVASVIQKTGKAVPLFYFFNSTEWSREIPILLDYSLRYADDRALRHAVTAVDFTLKGGKKALLIEDSAHFGGLTRRFITEEFHRDRNADASYPMNFVFDKQTEKQKPQHAFVVQVAFGEYSPEVTWLQKCLQYEGLFPINVTPTTYYGPLTAQGVLAFQQKYKVAPAAELEDLGGRTLGPKTRDALNERFA